MLSYTFSKREKVLLVVLALILIGLVWYMLVWQGNANEKLRIDSEIAEVEAQTLVARNKVSKLQEMQTAIDEQKNSGAQPASLPQYDNTTALMAKLDAILASTKDYRLAFDELDYSQEGMVARGVTITFGCESMDAAHKVMEQLEASGFACTIDAATVASTSASDARTGNARVGVNTTRNVDSPYACGLHVIFYEKA